MTDEDFVTYRKLLKRCRSCMQLKLRLEHTSPPNLDSRISWWLAEENIQEMFCAKGRLRYSDGREKRYTSKYPLRVECDLDADCPDYDPDDLVDDEE